MKKLVALILLVTLATPATAYAAQKWYLTSCESCRWYATYSGMGGVKRGQTVHRAAVHGRERVRFVTQVLQPGEPLPNGGIVYPKKH